MTLSTELTIALITGAIAVMVSAAAFIYGWVNVSPLRGIIEELRTDIGKRKEREVLFEARHSHYLKRIAYLTNGIRVLLEQIKRHNEPPCWEPVDWDPDDISEEIEHSAAADRRTRPRDERKTDAE